MTPDMSIDLDLENAAWHALQLEEQRRLLEDARAYEAWLDGLEIQHGDDIASDN